MDSLYMPGANSIRLLQNVFPNSTNYFTIMSEVADPAKAFTIIFPVTCVISLRLGANILAASLAAEWIGIMLKWILMEHRPYWWVNLVPERPLLKQTHLTCETGPGSPSGHMTGITVVLFVIAQWLCQLINEETLLGRVIKRRLNKLIWFFVWIGLINFSLSRMYHSTHFPHQCLLGIGAGFAIGNFICGSSNRSAKWWERAAKTELLLLSVLLALIGLAFYHIQLLIGVNPDWSVQLASRWCSKMEYLHVNTMPLFSLVRDVGACCGIALCSPLCKRVSCPYNRSISAVLTFLTHIALQKAIKEIPTVDPKMFYSCHFMLNAIQPYFMLVVIPYVSLSISKWKSKR